MPVADIANADAIVIVGSNLRHEVPLLHARVRKAWTRGAKVHVVNPVDFDFTFKAASNRIVAPSQIAASLADAGLRDALKDATRAVVIVGGVAENSLYAAAIRKAAAEFASATNAKLCRIPQGANAVGLSQHGVLPRSRDAQAMLAQPRSAYVIYGIEPGLDFADVATANKALASAQVVAFSHYACRSTRAVADVILPVGALPEIEATLTNLDGFAQSTIAGGKLPGEARPGWRVLRALGGELNAAGFDFTDLDGVRTGLRKQVVQVAAGQAPKLAAEGLELAVTTAIYRSDATVRRAASLQSHPLNVAPCVVMHPADAESRTLREGVIGRFTSEAGTATLPVVVSDKVARGTVWIEGGHGATAPLGADRVLAGKA